MCERKTAKEKNNLLPYEKDLTKSIVDGILESRNEERRKAMDLDDVKNIVIIGYTAWKWKTEYDEHQKKRRKGKQSKQKPKRRSKK